MQEKKRNSYESRYLAFGQDWLKGAQDWLKWWERAHAHAHAQAWRGGGRRAAGGGRRAAARGGVWPAISCICLSAKGEGHIHGINALANAITTMGALTSLNLRQNSVPGSEKGHIKAICEANKISLDI